MAKMKPLMIYLAVVILLFSLQVCARSDDGSEDENDGHISDAFQLGSHLFDEPSTLDYDSSEEFRRSPNSNNILETHDLLEDFTNVFEQPESTAVSLNLMENKPRQRMRRKRPRHELEDTESQSESSLIPNNIHEDDISQQNEHEIVQKSIAAIEELVKTWKNLPKQTNWKFHALIAGEVAKAGGVREMLDQFPGAWDCMHKAHDSLTCVRKRIVLYHQMMGFSSIQKAAVLFFMSLLDNWTHGSNGNPPLKWAERSLLPDSSVWDKQRYIVSTIDLFDGDVDTMLNPLKNVLLCFKKMRRDPLQCVYEFVVRFRESLDENYLESATKLIDDVRTVWDGGHPDFPDLGPWSLLNYRSYPKIRKYWCEYRSIINAVEEYSNLQRMFDEIPAMRFCFTISTTRKSLINCIAVAINRFKRSQTL